GTPPTPSGYPDRSAPRCTTRWRGCSTAPGRPARSGPASPRPTSSRCSRDCSSPGTTSPTRTAPPDCSPFSPTGCAHRGPEPVPATSAGTACWTPMDAARTTVRDLRRHNRSVLLSRLFFDGPLSRHELARLSGLSAATVSNVTADHVDDRLVVEAGQVESDGGRPRVLLRVDPEYGYVVGIDVGETGVKVELFDLAMSRLSTVERGLPSVRPQPAKVVAHIAGGLREVVSQAGVDERAVLGVGVGVPGTVEQGTSALVHAPTIGWEAVPLQRLLRATGTGLPLYFDNGAKTLG